MHTEDQDHLKEKAHQQGIKGTNTEVDLLLSPGIKSTIQVTK